MEANQSRNSSLQVNGLEEEIKPSKREQLGLEGKKMEDGQPGNSSLQEGRQQEENQPKERE